MIKLARKYSFDKYGKGRATIITLNNSFHGRTITTLMATGQEVFHNYFFPFTEGLPLCRRQRPGQSLEAAAGDDVCAVMMELVQGEGGVLPLDQDYVQAVAKLCAERDWLLLVDEVQTGVGRTGSLFAFQQYGVLPDVVSFAKGIAGGLPMSGILANEKCRNVLGPGTHATTFGANPVCAAAGLVVQETLTDAFLEDVQAKGTYLRNQIEALHLPCFGATRGMGLMIGIEVREGYTNKEIAAQAHRKWTAGPHRRPGHAAAAAPGDLQGGDGQRACHHAGDTLLSISDISLAGAPRASQAAGHKAAVAVAVTITVTVAFTVAVAAEFCKILKIVENFTDPGGSGVPGRDQERKKLWKTTPIF